MSISTVTAYRCGNDERLAAVRGRAGLNGIEAIELVTPPGPLTVLPRELDVLFVKPVDVVPPVDAIRITGGSRAQGLTVVDARATHDPRTIRVELDAPGDLTEYHLELVDHATQVGPPAGIDPILAHGTFSFAVVCQSEADCVRPPECPPTELDDPRLDRLARDYPGLRRLLLDRMAIALPDWRRRNPADVRVVLVELLAYLGDQLSYQQDAVATEAYLGTARRRISARRHARLVDYRMHDGLSARAFLQLVVGAGTTVTDGPARAAHGTFMTAPVDQSGVLDISTADGRREYDHRRRTGERVFHVVEAIADGPAAPAAALAPHAFTDAHNRLTFHTWSGDRCCLPVGATSATLAGTFEDLRPEDVLILVQDRDPDTGEVADADPVRRHPVRLTHVDAGTGGAPLLDPVDDSPITEIEWDPLDALPFALVVSDADGHTDAGIALGNIVLVEEGAPEPPEELVVPEQTRPWRPTLSARGLSQSAVVPGPTAPAASVLQVDPAAATPAVSLEVDGVEWTPSTDLIDVGNQTLLVAEVDDEGDVTLRFGVPEPDLTYRHGRPPEAAEGAVTTATVRYRTGVGPLGNVGGGTIRRVVHTGDADHDLDPALAGPGVVDAVTNPLPAWGGAAPESIESVRQRAPFLFNVQERAVTAEDYARRAEQFRDSSGDGVQRAVAQLRWTGAWYTVFVAVDRVGGAPVTDEFERDLRAYLEPYRMAGHDLEIEGAIEVPLEVNLTVDLRATAFRSVVMDTLTDKLSNRRLPDGSLGLFHADRLTFAQTVYLSPIVAEAQQVPGVRGVTVTRFGPYRRPAIELKDVGALTVGRNEIPRLDNDPSRPDRGVLAITLTGGR